MSAALPASTPTHEGDWRRLFEALPELAVVWLSTDGTIIGWSPRAERLLGGIALSAGAPLAGLYHTDSVRRGQPEHDLRLALVTGRLQEDGWRLRGDGTPFWARATMVALRADGQGPELALVLRDLTAARRTEEALRASEERLGEVLEAAVNPLLFLDRHGRVTYANPAAEALFAAERGVLLQRRYDDPAWGLEGGFGFLRVMRTGEPVRDLECRLERAGATLTVAVDALPIGSSEGAPREVAVSLRDVTAVRRAAEEHAARVRLRAMSRRLLEAQEEERRRLARELHDEAGQALTALKLSLQAAVEGAPADPALVRARELADELLARVRALSLDLRPALLDDLGLLPALLWLVERYTSHTGVEVQFEHVGIDSRFEAEVENALFRVTQEALTNVARHSGVEHATLRIWSDELSLSLQVQDQGRGFDPEAAAGGERSSGVSGMRDRLWLLGGQLTLESAPGQGTRLTAELPLVSDPERGRSW